MTTLPLHGVRVVEISHMVMGPACGMLLAQLGADVVKVEPIDGDKTRRLTGMATSFFPLFNRGKRSVAIDLDSPGGKEVVHRLLASADVFIENFKDDTVKRLGLDAAGLAARYPRLIIGAHKGFLSGPYEHRPALDEVVQMMTGLAYMTGSREIPHRVGASINDIMGGMFGVIGILAALRDRDRTGKGAEIRIGLFENCLFAVAQHIVQYQITGVPVPPMPQRVLAWPIYDIFTTKDDRRLFVAVTTNGHWQAFCRAFEFDHLLADPQLQTVSQRIDARAWLVPMVAERLLRETAAQLEETLDLLSIPFSQINAPEEMLDDPHVRRSGGLVEMTNIDGRAIEVPTLPLEFDGEAFDQPSAVPALGADTFSVLSQLGFSETEIARLTGTGAVEYAHG